MFPKLTTIATTIVVCLLATSCGPSTIVQCNQLINSINKGNSLVNAKTSYDAETTNQLAGELKEIAVELENLELEDENLLEFQNDFVQTFKDLSQAFIQMSLALETSKQLEASFEGRQKFNDAKNQLNLAGQTANKVAQNKDALLDQLVTYCQEK
ncbi:MAG: hypothetical protein QNJ68_03750 [Microcoleaceae cyanobacterium MO_207.B10]|nr:hypothetical protein [Microcoleaceae cyanobacterium MO_207.B10]